MNNYQIDVWKNYYEQAGYQNFENILLAIKEGKFKSEITEIRNSLKENNKNKSDRLKNSLSGFTVSAIFDEERRKERVIKYYGVMVLDIDDLKDEEVDPKVLFGAIRYAFLKYKVGGDIVFDVKDSVWDLKLL